MVGWFTDDPLYLQPGQKCLLAAWRWFHAEPDPGPLHQARPAGLGGGRLNLCRPCSATSHSGLIQLVPLPGGQTNSNPGALGGKETSAGPRPAAACSGSKA